MRIRSIDSSRNVSDYIIPSSSGVHDGLAGLLAKGILEVGAIVLGQEITSNGLTTVLVDSLEDLVTGGISQTREERNELLSDSSGGRVPEDDLVQLARTRDLKKAVSINCPCARIERRAGLLTRDWLLINRFAMVSTWWRG